LNGEIVDGGGLDFGSEGRVDKLVQLLSIILFIVDSQQMHLGKGSFGEMGGITEVIFT
jgi:hypothetical protein